MTTAAQIEAARERLANEMRTEWAASAVRRSTDEWVVAQVEARYGSVAEFLANADGPAGGEWS